MTQDPDFRDLLAKYCTTATAFEQVLSVLLVTAHRNGIDVSGGWEAHDNGSAPEWDVVVTPLQRGTAPSADGDGTSDEDGTRDGDGTSGEDAA